jgi:hypothetical protein
MMMPLRGLGEDLNIGELSVLRRGFEIRGKLAGRRWFCPAPEPFGRRFPG